MSAIVQKILDIARGEIGVTENPSGSNKVKYNDAYGGGPKAWCCVYIWWLFREAEASKLFYGGDKTAYVPTLLSFHKKAGQAVTKDYQPGDVIFFDFNSNGVADHVGLCESWDGKNITTIDGNTGEGSEANGGAVMRRTRSAKYIVGAFRPDWDVVTDAEPADPVPVYSIDLPLLKKGSADESVRALQMLLTGRGYSTNGADGKFGSNTDTALRRFQRENGLTVDGRCGPKTWSALIVM